MLIKNNTIGKIEDFSIYKDVVTLYGNKAINFEILKDSKTLEFPNKMIKTAKYVKIIPKESDFIYIRSRAVSSGNVIVHADNKYELVNIDDYYKDFRKYSQICRNANLNGDFFCHEELTERYKTFIGKSVFVDHNNDNVNNARGIILDAIYNNNGYYVELLEAIDKKAFPQLAGEIEKKRITDTSMGCSCGYTICSICGNEAHTEDDFCEHILNYKSLTYDGLPVFEDNRNVNFFEDSIITTMGADPEAKILEKVASKTPRTGNNIQTYYHERNDKQLLNEVNQRSENGRIQSMAKRLQNLPWT